MSNLLSVSITFLGDLFHGQGDDGPEWPPSPHRVYQAMLGAAAQNGCDGDAEFEWFERLEPPVIIAPQATLAQQREFFVPNNDADVSKKFERQSRLTSKMARPTRILGKSTTVRYLWAIPSEEEGVAQKLMHHARLISAVGWGIDLVVADGQLVDAEDPAWLTGTQRWIPALCGRILRCPAEGTLRDLRKAHESFVNRVDGKFYQQPRRPGTFREIVYRAEHDDIPGRPYLTFKLLRPDDDSERFANFDPRRAMHVAAWMRGQACRLAQPENDGFLDGYDPEQYVAGHVPKEARDGPEPATILLSADPDDRT